MPLIAHWPAVIEPESRCDALVGLNDFLATFAELIGVDLPQDVGPDSISFARRLSDPQSAGGRQNLVMQSALECFVVRTATGSSVSVPAAVREASTATCRVRRRPGGAL